MIKNIVGVSLFLLSSAALNVQAATLCTVDGDPNTDGLSTTDVTFGVSGTTPTAATDCYGVVFDTDDFGGATGKPEQILYSINEGFGSEAGNDWTYLVKDDNGLGDQGTYMDIEFDLATTGNGTTSGDWTLSWTDTTGSALPKTLDVVAVVKASDRWADYIFDDFEFTASPTEGSGTWQVSFTNNGGQIPGISGLWLYVREGTGGSSGSNGASGGIPEPSTLFLGALGLVGIGFSRRRQR